VLRGLSSEAELSPAWLFNGMKRHLREPIKALSRSAPLIWINTKAARRYRLVDDGLRAMAATTLPSHVMENTDVGPDVRFFRTQSVRPLQTKGRNVIAGRSPSSRIGARDQRFAMKGWNLRLASGLLKTRCDYPPHYQNDDCANDCTNKPCTFASFVPPDRLAKVRCDEGSDNAEHRRQYKARRLIPASRMKELCYHPCHKANYDGP
jgi:hypothetical protein